MRLLYPEPGGCHPVVRTRDVEISLNGDIIEYSQFGLAPFIVNTMTHTNQIEALPETYRIVKIFVLGNILSTRKISSTQTLPTMDWPNLKYTLRSKEAMNANGAGAPMDSGVNFDDFWVAVKQLALEKSTTLAEDNNATQTQNTSTPTQNLYYSKNTKSTLDMGGDCHRSPLLKMTQKTLELVLNSDVCYVRFQENHTTRQLEYSNVSMSMQINVILSTTTQHKTPSERQLNKSKNQAHRKLHHGFCMVGIP